MAQPRSLNLSIAISTALQYAGIGIGRFASGLLLGSDLLPEQWSLFAVRMTRYHALFAGNAILLLLWFALLLIPTVLTIGFVPFFVIAQVWFAYRMIKGWLRLNDGRAVP